jgi:hypothetical protein
MATCLDSVFAKFPKADRKDLEAIYDAMSRERKAGFLDAAGNPDAEFMKKAQGMIEAYQRGVMKAKIKVLQNAVKDAKRQGFYKADPFKGNKAEAIQAKLTGTFKQVEGGRRSVDYDIKGREQKLLSGFLSDLHESGLKGLEDIIRSEQLDDAIRREKWELANGRDGGVTGNKEALAVAKAWENLHAQQLIMKNDAGAFVNKLEGRVEARFYDRDLMMKEGEEAFKKFMLENLDYDKSFKRDFYTIDAVEAIDSLWKNVTEGKQQIPEGSNSDQAVRMFGAPANMARLLERGRSFHFNSPEAEIEFAKRFGGKSVSMDIVRSIQETARKSGLMREFGTNPENAFLKDIYGLSAADKAMLMRHWKAVDGSTNIPGNSPAAKWGSAARKIADMSSLGMNVLAQVPDLATRAGEMRMQGDSFFSALADSVKTFFENIPKDQRDEVGHILGIGVDSRIGDFFDRYGTTEGGKFGWVNSAHQKFFKLTGTKFVTEVNEAASAQQLAARIGYNSNKSFGELNPQYGRVLQKYGIGVPEWELLRSATQEAEGARFVGWGDVQALENKGVWERRCRPLGWFRMLGLGLRRRTGRPISLSAT